MTLKIVKPVTKAQKATQTAMETVVFTVEDAKRWKLPAFQRQLKINERVEGLAETIKEDGGVIPGILTIGVHGGERYIIDGQHRREAFLMSGAKEGYADIRYIYFEDMASMGEEFVNLNSSLVRIKADDVLRGLEGSIDALQDIRKACPFIGYDNVKRNPNGNGPVVSMSTVLRCWYASDGDMPASSARPSATIAREMTVEDTTLLIRFMKTASEAWGKDPAYYRLWSSLNLATIMWCFRNMHLKKYSARSPQLTMDQFRKCLMSLSADQLYLDWLVGRNLSKRDLGPAYSRIKLLFARRLQQETGTKPTLPAPAWASDTRER